MSNKAEEGQMYSTGEIARLCQVSVRTVQYYDQRGILEPSQLSEGGRRMYTKEDVRKLHLLTYLRSLGLSIDNIARIQKEENAPNVIETLLEEQIRSLEEEMSEKQQQLSQAKGFLDEVRSAKTFSSSTIQDIASQMKNKELHRKMIRNLIITTIVMGVIEYGTLIYALVSKIWWPFAVGMGIVVILSVILFHYYCRYAAFICPECHEVFQAAKKEILWARHTAKTRKLTCPHCGRKSFCIETALDVGEKAGSH